jgi:hypothetical protein
MTPQHVARAREQDAGQGVTSTLPGRLLSGWVSSRESRRRGTASGKLATVPGLSSTCTGSLERVTAVQGSGEAKYEELLSDLLECGNHPLTYEQETHGELELDAHQALSALLASLARSDDLWSALMEMHEDCGCTRPGNASACIHDGPALLAVGEELAAREQDWAASQTAPRISRWVARAYARA